MLAIVVCSPTSILLFCGWQCSNQLSPIATMPRKKYRPVDMRELTKVSRKPDPSLGLPTETSNRRAFTFNSGPSSRNRRPQPLAPGEGGEFGPLLSTIVPTYLQISHDHLGPERAEASLELEPRHLYSSLGDPPPCVFLESDFPPLPASDNESIVAISTRQQRRSVTLPEPLEGLGTGDPPRSSLWSWASRSERPASPESTVSRLSAVGNRPSSEPGPNETEWVSEGFPDYFARLLRKDSALDVLEPVVYTARHAMASAYPQMSGDARRHFSSGPHRYENRAPVRPTTCKNGPLCRKYQEGLIKDSLSHLDSPAHTVQAHVLSTMTFHQCLRTASMCQCSSLKMPLAVS